MNPLTDNITPDPSRVRSVSQLTGDIKGVLEPAFREVWVRGEISNFRRQASGHCYFTLKDDRSQLPTALFRSHAAKVDFPFKEGQQVLAYGRVSIYEPRGAYQLVASLLLQDGIGRLQQQFEQLKRKLEAEGLFARDRKQALPQLPRRVVFITSPTGAAIRDFISILSRRNWPGTIRVYPVRVQGAEAAAEIAAALRQVEAEDLGDLIVVGRGGGSLEDLWAFNEEVVVRAIAACKLPVISAVGHEIDFTLSDFAADHRAETPSAAAEWIAAAHSALLDRFRNARRWLGQQVQSLSERQRQRLELLAGRLREQSPSHRINLTWMQLDELCNRWQQALDQQLRQRREAFDRARQRLDRLDPSHRLELARLRLKHLEDRLHNAGPDAALNRGYALLQDPTGKVISRIADWPKKSPIKVRLKDGEKWVESAAERG